MKKLLLSSLFALSCFSQDIRVGTSNTTTITNTPRVVTFAGGGGGGSFTFVQSATPNVSDGSSATQTVQLTGVTAGNLIVVGSVMWYRTLSAIMTGGQATATKSGSAEWASRIITFKVE